MIKYALAISWSGPHEPVAGRLCRRKQAELAEHSCRIALATPFIRFILQQNATFSRYRNTLDMGISSVSLNLSSGITQAGYAARLEWTRGNLQWNGGVEYNYYHFRPMQFEVSGSFIENETPKFLEDAHEANAYLQADISIRPYWSVLGGLRLSSYHSHGRSFISPDPRITLNYHLVLPYFVCTLRPVPSIPSSDVRLQRWVARRLLDSSSPSVCPQQAHSIALGYYFRSQKG